MWGMVTASSGALPPGRKMTAGVVCTSAQGRMKTSFTRLSMEPNLRFGWPPKNSTTLCTWGNIWWQPRHSRWIT